MTDQQKKAVEEEFSRFSEFHRLRLSDVSEIYEKGMLEVLNNLDRYGLIDINKTLKGDDTCKP